MKNKLLTSILYLIGICMIKEHLIIGAVLITIGAWWNGYYSKEG